MGHQHCSHHSCHHEEEGHHEPCSCSCHHHACEHAHHEEHHHDHHGFAQQLIELADDAWMSLLSEKIRHHVESSCGKQIDELAKLVAEANNSRWKSKMEGDKACKEFKQKVSDFFNKK